MAFQKLHHLSRVSQLSSLTLLALLPFLVLFGGSRDIDLQGLLLLVSGLLATIGLLADGSLVRPNFALSFFLGTCLISAVVSPHITYGLIGAPLVRLGSLAFLALLASGLLVARTESGRLRAFLYGEIVLIGSASVMYSIWRFHTLYGLGGLFAQADIMACFIGCGLLFGIGLSHKQAHWLLIFSQFVLAVLLGLTGTRVVIILVVALLLAWTAWQRQQFLLAALISAVVLLSFHLSAPHRSTDVFDAKNSLDYRLDLQGEALRMSFRKPLFGYGPGNLADALDCRNLHAATLQQSCREGYFFNSSHNIFLDRILVVGWPGSLAFMGFVLLALYRGFRQPATRVFALSALLIALYYFTNVTSVTLELLFWVLLVVCLHPQRASRA